VVQKELPDYAAKFIELVLQIVADHGPAVSGAHNAIVASCAGKDLISSLCSGLLTIGPRFGGAIDDAAREFKRAKETQMTPEQFVSDMKKKGINIPGIGHKIKSVKNPDKRVQLLIKYARANFPSTELLDYALQVEQLTTAKKGNLILNVDGCIGILFLDLMSSCGAFSKEEIDEIVRLGYLNGLLPGPQHRPDRTYPGSKAPGSEAVQASCGGHSVHDALGGRNSVQAQRTLNKID